MTSESGCNDAQGADMARPAVVEWSMQQQQSESILSSLRQLRRYVVMASWVVGLSLFAQTLVWALSSFTDLRYVEVEQVKPPPLVVQSKTNRQPLLSQSLPDEIRQAIEPSPVLVRSNYDHFFRDVTSLTLATGSLGLVVLLLLLTLSTIVMTVNTLPGVPAVVSSAIWAILVAVLALPASVALEMPWPRSGLCSYDAIIADLEAKLVTGESLTFYLGSLAVPLMCLVGMLVVATKYNGAVKVSLPAARPFLDPKLEAETAAIKPGSLHGINSAALDKIVESQKERELKDKVESQTGPRRPGASQVSPGQMPRRVI